jgi:very-short-patch-repair endonuclease
MSTKTLFSRHYLENRLPDHPEWAEDPQPVFETVHALWEKARQYGNSWNEAQTEEEFVRPVLEALGWPYIVQPKSHHGGSTTRPDYALFADEASRQAAYPHQGHDDAFYSRALAIAEAKYWGRPLSQKDTSGRETWKAGGNPSHQMVSYLVGTRVPWGILTNGRIWRLYSREVSSTASEFYEVDLSDIFTSPHPQPPPLSTQWRGEGARGRGEVKPLVAKVPGYIYELARQLRQRQIPAEALLWQCLRNRQLNGLKFRRQHPLGRYIADFYCAEKRLVIELEGVIHQEPRQQQYDLIRQQEIKSRGLTVLRFTNEEVETKIELVLEQILDAATSPPLHRVERGSGGEVSHPVERGPGSEVSHPVERGLGGEVSHPVERGLGGEVEAFKRFWLFFRRDAFLPDAQGRSFVQRVHEGSATYAREISDKLKELVFEQVMPEIAGGFVAYRHHQLGVREETEASLRQIYQASLSLLYKTLFLLYAEARSLLPIANLGYREQSLTAMAQWAAEWLDRGLPLSSATHATPRYDALLALFHRVDQGDPSLGIPRYNGGLFNPASPDNQFLEKHKLSDRAVARAVDILVRDVGQPVDYAYISVRNLGAIYEGLLENRLRVVDTAAGQVELVNDRGERKASGSYYTPDYIVEYIVQHTLDPILAERDAAFRAAMDRCAGLRRQLQRTSNTATVGLLRGQLDGAERDAREAFLGIKVLDPAMGSGHFLVNAVDHLTDGIIQRMQAYHDEHPDVPWEWNPIQRLIEKVRREIMAEMERQGIVVDPARLDDTALLTRLVMKRCIYGVDLNPMAVELAKLSLWLHSFTVGAPLSFLDHHLRWGNSLIGIDEVQEYIIPGTERWNELLRSLTYMVQVSELTDATFGEIHESSRLYSEARQAILPNIRRLNVELAASFDPSLMPIGQAAQLAYMSEEVITETPPESQRKYFRAQQLTEEKGFFHWKLEFPEVFMDLRRRDWAENPGFDAVVGNPPYVRQEQISGNKPFFQARYVG